MGADRFNKRCSLAQDYAVGRSRPHLVEALEPRLLLSADHAIGGTLVGDLNDGLDVLGETIQDYIDLEDLFDTFVPGVLEADVAAEALLSRIMHDLFNIVVDQDQSGGVNGATEPLLLSISSDGTNVTFEDYFAEAFAKPIADFLTDWGEGSIFLCFGVTNHDCAIWLDGDTKLEKFAADFDAFLGDLDDKFDTDHPLLVDLFDLNVVSNGHSLDPVLAPEAAEFFIEFTLTFNHELILDLGAQADDLGIFFPDDGSDGQTTDVDASVSVSMTLGLDLLTNDFYITPNSDMTFKVETPNATLVNADVHVGFLGTRADGAFDIDMPIDAQLLDPSTPNFLGFTAMPTIQGNMIVADAAPRNVILDFDIPITFTLMLGTHDMVPITVTLDQDDTDGTTVLTVPNVDIQDLADDLQAAINTANAALGELLVVEVVNVNGEDRLAIRVITTDADPFGFNNEKFEADPDDMLPGDTVTITAAHAPIGDGATSFEFTTDISFLLSIDGSLPFLITLPATDPAIEELGFAVLEEAQLASLLATNPGPVDGLLGIVGDGSFFVQVIVTDDTGATTSPTLEITEAAWIGNGNLSHLAQNIQDAINASALTGLVTVSTGFGRIRLTRVFGSGVTSIAIGAGDDETDFGFASSQLTRLFMRTDANADATLTGDATIDVVIDPVTGPTNTVTIVIPEGTSGLTDYVNEINLQLAGTDIEAVISGPRIILRVKAANVADVVTFEVKVPKVTLGNTTIGDLVEDLDRALQDLGGLASSVDAGSSGGLLTLSVLDKSLEITRTVVMDFEVKITTTEMELIGTDLFETEADPSATFNVNLTLTPDAGLLDPNDSDNPYNTTNHLKVLFDPFDPFDADADDHSNPWELRTLFGVPPRLSFRLTDGAGVELLTEFRSSLLATSLGPVNGRFLSPGDRDLTITLDPGTGPETITIFEADWDTNTTLQHLIDDINDAINAGALMGLVVATIDRGRIRLNPVNSLTTVEVSGGDETDFGFGANQVSTTDTEFDKFLAFNVISAPEVASLISQLGNFLDQLIGSDFALAFDLAFADVNLGEILDFGDLLRDELLFDDGDIGIADPPNTSKLLRKVGDALQLNFVTAQDMAKILNTLLSTRDFTAPGNILSGSGNLSADATFDVEIDGTVHHVTVPGFSLANINLSHSFLIADINAAMVLAGISGGTIDVHLDGSKVLFRAHDDAIGSFTVTSTNAVAEDELGLGAAPLSTGSGIARYNDLNGELTFDLRLTHSLIDESLTDGLEIPINFDLDLDPLLNIFSETTLEVEAEGHLNAVFGIKLGNSAAALSEDTELALLNDGRGILINENLALTSDTILVPIVGRLTGDAVFELRFNVDGDDDTLARVTVAAGDTTDNVTIQDLVDDINDALALAEEIDIDTLLDIGVMPLTDYVQASYDGERIVLTDVEGGPVNLAHFQLETDTNNPAFTELGFHSQDAASLVLDSGVDVVDPAAVPAGIGLEIVVDHPGGPTMLAFVIANTTGNLSVTDLVVDINEALDTAQGSEEFIVATRVGNRVVFRAIDSDIDGFTVKVTTGNAHADSIGYSTSAASAASVRDIAVSGETTVVEIDGHLGHLNADADFTVNFNATDFFVTVLKTDTNANRNIGDLIDDINDALQAEGIASNEIIAEEDNSKVRFRATGNTVLSFTVDPTNTAAETDLGLGSATLATDPPLLTVRATQNAPLSFGVSTNISFDIEIMGAGPLTRSYAVTLDADDTIGNRSLFDLAGDLNSALDAAFAAEVATSIDDNPFRVIVQSGRLVIGLKTDASVGSLRGTITDPDIMAITDFEITGGTGELELSGFADKADLIIVTSDGMVHRIILDDLLDMVDPTLQDFFDVITLQTGGTIMPDVEGSVTAEISDDRASIKLTNNIAFVMHDDLFHVETVNGSPAAQNLGILASDANSIQIEGDTTVAGAGVEDHVIEGSKIASIDLLDRFFVRELDGMDFLSALLTISAPDGVEVGASFGFVSVRLFSDSNFTLFEAEAGIGFANGEITLRDMFDSLSELQDSTVPLLNLPTLSVTDNDFSLNVEVMPALSIIDLGVTPTIDFTINFLGELNYVTSSNIEDGVLSALAEFEGAALTALGLGQFVGAGNRDLNIHVTSNSGETLSATITIDNADWMGNSSLQDLIDDINDEIGNSDLDGLVSALEVDGKITLNTEGATTAILVEFGADEADFGFLSDDIRMTGLPDVSFLGSLLDDLESFQNVSFDQILDAMKSLVDFLNGFGGLPFLDVEIPLLGVSFNEILGIADRFQQAVEDVELNPAGSLQLLEQKIREAFNLPDFTGADLTTYYENLGITTGLTDKLFDLALDVHPDTMNDLLRIDIRLPIGFSEALSLDLDLGDVEFLNDNILEFLNIDLQGQAGLSVDGFIDARLALAIDLNDFHVYLYDGETEISMGLRAAAENITFNAAIGPIGAFIKDGLANAEIAIIFEDAGPADGHLFKIFDFVTGLEMNAFDGFAAALTTGEVSATLPVYVPTENDFLGDIVLTISETDLDIGTWLSGAMLEIPDFSQIDLANLNPFSSIPLMLDGLDLFLATLQDLLDGEVFGFELPIIGDNLAGGITFIQELREEIIQPIRQLVEEAPELAETVVQHLMFAILGPGSALLPVMSETPGIFNQTLTDFLGIADDAIPGLNLLSIFEDGSDIVHALADFSLEEIQAALPFTEGSFEWQFRVGGVYEIPVDIDFDIGFPGLALDWNTPLIVELVWDMAIGVGVSLEEGAYLIIDNPRMVNGNPVSAELFLSLDVTLDESALILGQLGFLQLTIEPIDADFDKDLPGRTDDPDPTHFHAEFTVDLVNGDDEMDTKLSFSELGSLDAIVMLGADAQVNLAIIAEFNPDLLPDAISALLPSVHATFVLDWEFALDVFDGDGLNIGDASMLNLIAFNKVEIDMGSFLSDFLGPFVEKIQEITQPLQPIIDIVTAPIPVISDLAGQPITLLDLAAELGDFDPGMIYAIADLITFVNSIPAEAGMLMLPLGDFIIVGGAGNPDVGSMLTDGNFSLSEDSGDFSFGDALPMGFADTLEGFKDLLENKSTGDGDTKSTSMSVFDKTAPGAGDFGFPIFENPSSIFGLLMGRDVTLVTYDLPAFGIDFTYVQKFPIWGPLFARISLGFGVTIDLAFGYDTAGVREFAEGDFSNPLDLLAGFYISDTDSPDGTGTDVPELVLKGELAAGAELNIGIASAGIEAAVILTVNFDLYDPDSDGKVRIDELLGSFLYEWNNGDPILAPIAIFDVFGDISLQLRAFIEILFVVDLKFDITPPIVLFEFEIPFDREPILATERGDGSLLLHTGPNAAQRLNGDTRDIDETIHVKSIGGDEVKVWGFGVTESAAQVYRVKSGLIVGFGGEGADIFDLVGVTHDGFTYIIEGGTGDDIITTGKGSALIHGDGGDDILTGGPSHGLYWDDEIYGDDGNDIISGGGGNDIIFGDGGRLTRLDNETFGIPLRVSVFVRDGDGVDTINGDDGNDIIFGGGQSDTIHGDGGDDLIIGDGGLFDFVLDDEEMPTESHLPMADERVDVSRIRTPREGSRDILFGDAGDDTIIGGGGNDNIDGGLDDDQLYGGAGFDVMYGGSGLDRMFGETEDDIMFGFRDPQFPNVDDNNPNMDEGDIMEGGEGNDYMRGNQGDDLMFGGRGADIMFGDEHDDTMFGESGPDIMFGGAQADTIDAGDNNDVVFGDDGLLVYYGFYTDAGRIMELKDDGLAVDEDTLGSLIRITGAGDRLVGDGAKELKNNFADDDPHTEHTSDDGNQFTLDLIITEVNVMTDGNDNIIGGNANDIVLGGAKDDTIYGDWDPAIGFRGPRPAGNDVLIGDGGRIEFQLRKFSYIATIIPGIGETGIDTISGNDGTDYIFGGASGDFLYGYEAIEPLFDAVAAFEEFDALDPEDALVQFRALDANDDLELTFAESGLSMLLFDALDWNGDGLIQIHELRGGHDVLLPDISDNDVVLGDNGEIIFYDNHPMDLVETPDIDESMDGNSGIIQKIATTDMADSTGGDDTIEGYQGEDILIGGVNETDNSDMIFGGLDDDVILGDNGFLDFGDDPIAVGLDLSTLDVIHSEPDGLGGGDYIEGNAGQDVILGGNGGDIIHGFGPLLSLEGVDVADVILGDNGDIFLLAETGTEDEPVEGEIVLFGGAIIQIITSDTAETTGGADTIHGNIGDDIILGGVNDGGIDNLFGDEDNDVILGDNGQLDFANHPDKAFDSEVDSDMSTLDRILSHDDNLGGRDDIRGNQGADTAIGGTAGDRIYGDDETASHGVLDLEDTLIGDNAKILLSGKVPGQLKILDSSVNLITTIDTAETTGGADIIEGNALDDIIIGGVNDGGRDVLAGDAVAVSGGLDEDGQDPINDIILGDNGLLDYAFGDNELRTLDLIKTFDTGFLGGIDLIFGSDGADIVMGGSDGDFIYGDFYAVVDGMGMVVSLSKSPNPGSDIALIGDGGQIILLNEIENNIVILIQTIEVSFGGADMIQGNDFSDKIMGGFDGDLLYGETSEDNLHLVQDDMMNGRAGDDWILGDNGRFDYDLAFDFIEDRPDVEAHLGGTMVMLDDISSTLDRVTTTDPIHGGADVIYGNGGNDTIFGGTAGDMIRGDTSDAGPGADGADGIDLMFGDHAKLYPNLPSLDPFFLNNNFFSIDTQVEDLGFGDVMFGNANDDIMIGGQGDDVMFGGTGDDDMIGGHNVQGGHDDLDAMPALDQLSIDPNVLADLNPRDVNEINDFMDGGDDDDVMAGDNAYIIRQLGLESPRFRMVGENGLMYTILSENLEGLADVDVGFEANVTGAFQEHQDMTLVRTVHLFDHDEATEDAAVASPGDPRPFGNDIMTGGGQDDEMWGQLGDDIIQGDGEIERIFPHKEEGAFDPYNPAQDADPSFDLRNFIVRFDLDSTNDEEETMRFSVFEALDDGDDYIEGNGGNDRIYGNLGQDDIIGGSSTLFGLDTNAQRPDGADLIYGGAGNPKLLERNASIGGVDNDVSGDTIVPEAQRHGFDADVILGDNGDIFRLVTEDNFEIVYETFNYDYDAVTADGFVDDGYGGRRIRPRAVNFADYGYSYEDTDSDAATRDVLTFLSTARGEGDLIYGESGDDIIHGMTGNDAIFGNSGHDDLYGEIGTDFLLGGTGIDGILGDDGLLMTRRNDLNPEPLFGIVPRDPDQGELKRNEEVNTNSLNAEISTPGNIQRAVINIEGELVKQVEVFAFRTDDMDGQTAGEFDDSLRFNDIIFGGLQNDFIHGGDGDDAISGAEALPVYYSADPYGFAMVNEFLQNMQSAPPNGTPDLADSPFWFDIAPYNPGEILRFEGKLIVQENGQRTRTRDEFAWYDEFNPRRKIMFDFDFNFGGVPADFGALETLTGVANPIDFLLNFDEEEGPDGPTFINDDTELPTDGADRIFGDLGNDWIVGGTGRDHMYGGRGDDLLNMDDNHDSGAGGRVGPHDPEPDQLDNTQSDEFQAYADIVYSGAGRDIMILNTGADRSIDWVGEFNSYIVPFSPFGAFHISRNLQPQLPEFLQALSESDGADVRVDPAKTNNAPDAQLYVDEKTQDVRVDDPDPLRNFEPYGELGMVRQTDFGWIEQTGAPNDPQPGNLQGKREIMRRQLFNDDGSEKPAIRFAVEAGTWEISGGTYNVAPEFLGQESISLFHLDMYQPGYMEILVTANAAKDKAGMKSNAYIIYDYQSATDFKFAGIDVGLDKIQIGHFGVDGWVIDKQLNMRLRANTDYDLTVVLHGTVATLWVNESKSISFDFGDPLNDDGLLGLATDNSKASFDDFQVQQLPPVFTFENVTDFSDPDANPLDAQVGDWSVADGEFSAALTGEADYAIATQWIDVAAFSRLNFEALVSTDSFGGLVFDYYSPEDFKFAALDAVADQVIIGHVTSKGWVIDATADFVIDQGESYTLGVELFGTSVSVTINETAVVGFVFNSLLNDGEIGLFTRDAGSIFDNFIVKGDDPAYLVEALIVDEEEDPIL